jgi:hypothetical protein
VVAVHRDVDQRRPLVVGPLGAEGAQDRPLDADAGVASDINLHVFGDVGGEVAAVGDDARVHGDCGHGGAFAIPRGEA